MIEALYSFWLHVQHKGMAHEMPSIFSGNITVPGQLLFLSIVISRTIIYELCGTLKKCVYCEGWSNNILKRLKEKFMALMMLLKSCLASSFTWMTLSYVVS